MWEQIFNLALNNGLWAVLFCGLLIFQLKDSKLRETKYQDTIFELNKTLTKVNKIDENISVLTDNMAQVKEDVSRTLNCAFKIMGKSENVEEEDDEQV